MVEVTKDGGKRYPINCKAVSARGVYLSQVEKV